MHLVCSKTELNEAISMVQKAVATRSTEHILEGILLEASGDHLLLTGYDKKTGIESRVPADIREDGRIVVTSRMFGSIVQKLPEETVLIRTTPDFRMEICSGSAKFNIRGLDPLEYPKIPVVEEAEKITAPQSVLKSMIQQTIFACSTDESRPVMNGIYVTAKEGLLEMVAIDGFRLAVRREPWEGGEMALDFIVPSKAMAEAAHILDSSEEPVSIYLSHNHILFETERVRLVSRLIQGEFMDYRNILPKNCQTNIVVKSEDMLAAMERASLVVNMEQRRFPVTLENPSQSELMLSARTDIGHVKEIIPMEMTGSDIDIDFNTRYFLDVLKVIDDEKVRLEFSGDHSFCLIRPCEGDKFLYLVLPLRR